MRPGGDTSASPAHSFPAGGMDQPEFPQRADQLEGEVEVSVAARGWRDAIPALLTDLPGPMRSQGDWHQATLLAARENATRDVAPPASSYRGPPAASASKRAGQLLLPLPLPFCGRHQARRPEAECLRAPPRCRPHPWRTPRSAGGGRGASAGAVAAAEGRRVRSLHLPFPFSQRMTAPEVIDVVE